MQLRHRHGFQQRGRIVARLVARLVPDLAELARHRAQRLQQQHVLAGEILVDRAVRHAGFLHHVGDGGLADAVLADGADGGLDQLLAADVAHRLAGNLQCIAGLARLDRRG